MKDEILAAVMFLIRFIEKSETFPRDQLENFKHHLIMILTQRFEKHWFPEVPTRGQGYRCIRVNGTSPVELTLEQAALQCGLRYKDLSLPTELTVWVDPSEVCYRLGESEGSLCTLATFPSDAPRKMQRQKVPYDASSMNKFHHRTMSSSNMMPMTSLRMKPVQTRPRCDRTNGLLPPQAPLYRHHGYARNYKNILTV